jgi:hypothetical protein
MNVMNLVLLKPADQVQHEAYSNRIEKPNAKLRRAE